MRCAINDLDRYESHPQNVAATEGGAQPQGEPSHVEKLAGRAYGEGDAARGAATSEDAVGFGQPYWAQNAGIAAMDVLKRDHGALHTFGSLLAKHDRVDASDPCPAGIGRALPEDARGDHRLARSGGSRMEPRANAF